MKAKLINILLYFIFSVSIISCGPEIVVPDKFEIPSAVGENEIIEHYAYTLSYNETHEQADWVAYHLTRAEAISNLFERTNDFREDPFVTTISSQLSDYYLSGYDRGHLAPAGDMTWSDTAMSESFFLSNMSPQVGELNSGKWSSLEKQVREWADIYDGVYIVTGGVLKPGLSTIGANQVSVPEYYYKVVLKCDLSEGIAFVMPNAKISDEMINYAVTIDYVEDLIGIDFFPKMEISEQEKIESEINFDKWVFTYN